MSLLGNAMKNIIAARERQAQRYVARVMQEMGQEDARVMGRTRSDILGGR
ncbi:hypothetical protein [Rhizobium sp. L1K21]|nr:hypothetical protein [Rhizobium sp. L1K21]MCO6185661.1 hypothetical protein [Rhizobium sp. L1K21]